ncbi:MAG: type IV pilin protein [Steroidobacteraceae bacterium]
MRIKQQDACPHSVRGFTLLKLMVAAGMVAILAAIAIPSYHSYVEQAKVAAATADIMKIAQSIERYKTQNWSIPPNLAAIGLDTMLDPWGAPYSYLSFTGLKGKGQMRKDKNLVPINTAYDLYSLGADGLSKPPLTAAVSIDDVILANDGGYVGLASNY